MRPEDAQALVDAQDKCWMDGFDQPTAWTIENARDVIEGARSQWASGTESVCRFAVRLRETANFIGEVIVRRINPWDLGVDIEYRIAPSARKQGLAQEAVQLGCDFGLTELGGDYVEAQIDPDNAKSIRLVERLGFTEAPPGRRSGRDVRVFRR